MFLLVFVNDFVANIACIVYSIIIIIIIVVVAVAVVVTVAVAVVIIIYVLISLSLLKRGALGTFCAEVGAGRVLCCE